MFTATKGLTVHLPRLHPAQADILPNLGRFNVLACGRRFGKTKFGINRATITALQGKPVGWFAPNYKYIYEVWDDFVARLAPVTTRVSKQERRIELIGGGLIEFWTLDKSDAGRSRRYALAVIDEAAKVAGLEKAWNEAIRPTLADFGGGADFYSTPKGHDFFWRAFTWGEDPEKPEWRSFRRPTAANPYIKPSEIEAMRAGMPERAFGQEILAEFLDDAGGVFRRVSEAIDRGRKANEVLTGRPVTMGVDLARIEDFTVLSAVDDTGKQIYFERFNQISWERQIKAIVDAARILNARVVLDSTGVGDPIWERLRALCDVIPFKFTAQSKEQAIDNLAMRLERGRLRLMDIPEQEAELIAYQYEITPSRNVRMNAPDGMHDDCVIALALACWGEGHTYSAGAV